MAKYELAHPLYLDVQMMTSFLAFLEGGYSLEDEQKSTSQNSRDSEGKASAKAKFPPFLGLGAEAGTEGTLARKLENTIEYQAERHRTEASLFNYLYKRLREDEMLNKLSTVEDLSKLSTGQLVEVSGRYEGNPLSEILILASQYFSYIESVAEVSEHEKKQVAANGRSGNPAKKAASKAIVSPPQGQRSTLEDDPTSRRIMEQMTREMEISPVHDVLVSSFEGLKAVLTVSADYFSDATREFLREGEVKVMGKLTRDRKSVV